MGIELAEAAERRTMAEEDEVEVREVMLEGGQVEEGGPFVVIGSESGRALLERPRSEQLSEADKCH